jgi:hypothetical protein
MINPINFKEKALELLPLALNVLEELCPGGRIIGPEYRASTIYGNFGNSFSFNLKTGSWADFASPEQYKGGDIISYYAKRLEISQIEAVKQLEVRFGIEKPKPLQIEDAGSVIFTKISKELENLADFQHPKLGAPSAVYKYRDENGVLCFFVMRFDLENGKELRPLSLTIDGSWVWKIWPKGRPLFGIEQSKEKKVATLIVEGEKAALAAIEHLPEYRVLTWSGGANAIDKTDWSPLLNEKVVLWPDMDKTTNKETGETLPYLQQPGIVAMRRIEKILKAQGCDVQVIDVGIDEKLPSGYDAYDFFADGNTSAYFDKFLVEKTRQKNEIVETLDSDEKKIEILQNFPVLTEAGRPLNTLENFKYLLDSYGIIVRNNILTKKEEILIPNVPFQAENKENAQLAYIISLCISHKFPPSQIDNYLKFIANLHQYNPVATWITSKPWDGKSRFLDLCNTVKAVNEDSDEKIKLLKETYIRKWMISAIAAVFEENGVSAHGALVFQGEQGSGKTYWFKRLVPKDSRFAKDGLTLRTDNKDSIMQALSFWLVELGELDATFRKSDIAQLKSFLTQDSDTYRVPYARREATYARRTVFFASVNPKEFLHDETGNRRFWTIETAEIDYMHNVDMQQVWAEIYENHYKKGEDWVLDQKQFDLMTEANKDFESPHPIDEILYEKLDWDYKPEFYQDKTVTEVLEQCGVKNPNSRMLTRASKFIRSLNGNRANRTKHGRYLAVPPLKSKYLVTGLF